VAEMYHITGWNGSGKSSCRYNSHSQPRASWNFFSGRQMTPSIGPGRYSIARSLLEKNDHHKGTKGTKVEDEEDIRMVFFVFFLVGLWRVGGDLSPFLSSSPQRVRPPGDGGGPAALALRGLDHRHPPRPRVELVMRLQLRQHRLGPVQHCRRHPGQAG